MIPRQWRRIRGMERTHIFFLSLNMTFLDIFSYVKSREVHDYRITIDLMCIHHFVINVSEHKCGTR